MRSPPTYVYLNSRFRFCPRRHRKITSSFFFSLVHWTSKLRSEWCEFDSLNTLKLSYGKQSLHFQYYQSLISAKYISVLSSPRVSSEFPARARICLLALVEIFDHSQVMAMLVQNSHCTNLRHRRLTLSSLLRLPLADKSLRKKDSK